MTKTRIAQSHFSADLVGEFVVVVSPEEYADLIAQEVYEDMAYTFRCTCDAPVHDAEYLAISQTQAPCLAVQAMGIASGATVLVDSVWVGGGTAVTFEITTP